MNSKTEKNAKQKITPSFSWMVLSDMHFGRDDGNDYIFESLLNRIESDLINCDYVFIAGDIADKGEFRRVETNLKRLKNTFNSHTKFFFAMGNHDINNNKNKTRHILIKGLRDSDSTYAEFKEIITSDGSDGFLGKASDDFFSNVKNVFTEDLSENEMRSQIRVYKDERMNLIILNTAITSFDENDAGKLLVNLDGLNDILFDFDHSLPTFVMGHHPIDFWDVMCQKQFKDITHDKIDMYICGHSHDYISTRIYTGDIERNGSINPTDFIALTAGSCMGRWEQRDRLACNIIYGKYEGNGNNDVNVYTSINRLWKTNEDALRRQLHGCDLDEDGKLVFSRIQPDTINMNLPPIFISSKKKT